MRVSSPAKTDPEQRSEVQVRVTEGDYWKLQMFRCHLEVQVVSYTPGTCVRADVWICPSFTWTSPCTSLCSCCEGSAQKTETCGLSNSILVLVSSPTRVFCLTLIKCCLSKHLMLLCKYDLKINRFPHKVLKVDHEKAHINIFDSSYISV